MRRGLIWVVFIFISCSQTPEQDNKVEPVKAEAAVVETTDAFIGELVTHATASGLCRAKRVYQVQPRISGIVQACPVHDGQRVAKNDIVLTLEDREIKNELESARATYMQASIEYGRLRGERVNGTGIQQSAQESKYLSLTDAEKKLQQAQTGDNEHKLLWATAEYEAAKLFADPNKEALLAFQSGLSTSYYQFKKAEYDYEACSIRAPFAGVVGDVDVQAGDAVSLGTVYMQILDLDEVIVEVGLLESEINSIHTGSQARVEFTALPEVYDGVVTAVSPMVDRQKRTCRVEILVKNPQHKIKDGMYATAKIDADHYADVLLVPKEAVLERDNRKLVFIVRENKAQWCYVETGRTNDQLTEILSSKFDLKPGEPVIVDGHFTLVHDAEVRVEK